MRFPPPDGVVDCAPLLGASRADRLEVANAGACALEKYGYAAFRIGRLRLDESPSRALATAVMEALRAILVSRGAPTDLIVEADRRQQTIMPGAATVRTMLPHHDGQHSSYLTPSRSDAPAFRAEWRVFADDGFTTTASHKLYQGIFIVDPGEALSVTTSFDLVRIVREAYRLRLGEPAAGAVQRWLGDNLRAALAQRAVHGATYPTLAGLLGNRDLALNATALIRAEAAFDEAHLERFPTLGALIRGCPCGGCTGDTLRVFCHVVEQGVGQSWPEFCASYETCLVSERFDLLVSNNITMMHGGKAGGPSRLLDPYYLSTRTASGAAYEHWLAREWRLRLAHPEG